MYISEVQIENFRLFRDLSLNLNPGLNVIIGENNSGKTALIDAIRITLDTNSAEWTCISEKDFYKDSTNFKVRLKFEDIFVKQAYVFIEHLTHEQEDEKRKSVLYVNFIANLTDNLRRGNRFIRTEFRSGEDAEGPAIEREIKDYLSATYLKPLRDAEAELSAGRGSRLAQILSSSKKMKRDTANFENLLTEFIAANISAQNNPGISENREAIKSHFENLTFEENKRNFNLTVQILGGKDFSKMSESEKTRAFMDILERLSLVLDEKTPQQGLGYNNILFMATELLLLEQETGQFPLLLIEEPEAHLHPQLQMKFLKFIRDEYSNYENPKLQTILSTHSPNLASKAPLDSLIIMKDGKAYPIRREPEKTTELEDDDYEFLEKFLDVTKSNLFFAKGVLIVEGDAENILLPTIADLLGRPLENYGVSIVNVGNTAYTRYAKIFLRSGVNDSTEEWMSVKVACLRDLDLWPLKAKKDKNNGAGFKNVKAKNKDFWVKHTDDSGETLGTEPSEKKSNLKKLESQNVKVFVSEEWTFEYCLAKSGFADLIYEALEREDGVFDQLSDSEERAIYLYGIIESKSGGKTDVSYKLAKILKREYGSRGKKEELKDKLPQYILDALEYVTDSWPEDLDDELEPITEHKEEIPHEQESDDVSGI